LTLHGPIAITFLSFYITTLLFIPLLLAARSGRSSPLRPSARDWIRFIIAGVAGQVLAELGMTWGISRSLASNGAILNLLIPVISAILASLLLRERLTRLRIASLVIGLAGVLLMSMGDWQQSSFGQIRFLGGNLLILGGCLGSSFYNAYCKGLMQRFSEIEILGEPLISDQVVNLP
jgi:drug/metabolite transporter (DMT)-like permease